MTEDPSCLAKRSVIAHAVTLKLQPRRDYFPSGEIRSLEASGGRSVAKVVCYFFFPSHRTA